MRAGYAGAVDKVSLQ